LTDNYPDLTPYQYASDEPIANIDIDGLEGQNVAAASLNGAEAAIVTPSAGQLMRKASSMAASAVEKLSGNLAVIAARGAIDAMANANSLGSYDFFVSVVSHPHIEDYSTLDEQDAYLDGQFKGYVGAALQGMSEVDIGGGAAALGFATGGVGTVGAGVVVIHGVAVTAIATADAVKIMKQLYLLRAVPQGRPSTLSNDDEGNYPKHHIATNKNDISTKNGGPWSPKFRKIFEEAGLDIDNGKENLVKVLDHQGPHPEEYHKLVWQRLTRATKGLNPKTQFTKFRNAVINTLMKIAKEAQTPGTRVNLLITKK
jgi:hypothetical protein